MGGRGATRRGWEVGREITDGEVTVLSHVPFVGERKRERKTVNCIDTFFFVFLLLRSFKEGEKIRK